MQQVFGYFFVVAAEMWKIADDPDDVKWTPSPMKHQRHYYGSVKSNKEGRGVLYG